MTLEDLQHIFQPQIDEGTTKLYFMLVDGDYKCVERHDADNMEELLPMLSCFEYHGDRDGMPRFTK